jgi:outer membrane protein insertion porin family
MTSGYFAKKLKIIFVVLFACCFLTHPSSPWAQQSDLVKKIKVRGNQRVDESTILYYIKTKVDQPLSRQQIRQDIEQIYSLGQFKDIRVETEETEGGVELIFIVEEIASVGQIDISGNDKIETDDIREKITLKRGATFQAHLVKESEEEIIKLYHEKGYFFTQVKSRSKKTVDNLVDVEIKIREGEKVNIEKIRFAGNKSFSDSTLRDQMETREKTWYSWLDDSGIYQKDILGLDVFRVESFYQDKGFIRVQAGEPKIEVNKKDKEIYITIPISEGPRYKIGNVEVPGDDTVPKEEIRSAMQTVKGNYYSRTAINEDVLKVSDLYSRQGYAYADVNPNIKIDDKAKVVDIALEIDKGKKVYVGEISLLGNVVTQDNVIRREFRLKEGELFNSDKLKRSKQRINNLQFFEDVKIDTRRGKSPDLIDVVTTVTERPTGSLSVGAGFSSVENFIFTASVSKDNIFGRGQKLSFSTSLSSIRSDFNLSFTDPRVFDSEFLFGVDLFNDDNDFITFNSRRRGGGLRTGKSITEYDWVGLSYRYEDVKITDVDPQDVSEFLKNENRITSRISPTFIRDTRDDFLNPSTGWRHVVRFEVAGGILGGADFTRSGYEVTYYHPVIGKLIGAIHGEINFASGYGGDDLPAFERYFMGGPSSLRGFTIRDVGPKDNDGDPLGGEQSLLFNLELQYPFTKSLRGFIFYDRGNVYGPGPNLTATARSYDLAEMRDSVGGGIRFLSPFGPIGLSYGFKLDKQTGEDAGEFHFSAGSAF